MYLVNPLVQGEDVMQLPIVEPAPVIIEHSMAFRDLFENRKQFRHFQNYLTGLILLDNKTMTNMSRCILDSADKTNVSRFFSEAEWVQEQVNTRRIEYMLEQTEVQRLAASKSCVIIDDTLCEHVGSLFEHIDRHYNHSSNTYPLAHNLVTSHYVSGAVRFPVDARLYRRFEEVTHWETFVKKHFPERKIPSKKKAREQLHNEVDPILLKDPAFHALAEEFQTKITLASDLIEQAIDREFPFQTVLMDSWFLAPELVKLLTRVGKDWISLIKKNRKLETASFTVKNAEGQRIPVKGPHIKVEQLVEVLPPSAYKGVTVGDSTYYCFTKSLRIPSLGRVRIVICFANPELTGTYAVLVTNRRDWTAQQILQRYLQRWPIETFYQDVKGHLGLAAYRMRTAEAIKKHWCLVFTAYSLVHLECLPTAPIASTGTLPVHPIKTIGEVCRQQVQALIQALILFAHELLQAGESAQEVFAKLFTKQQVLATS
jgi:SRSO17 transposase